jgi:hypothetical protein
MKYKVTIALIHEPTDKSKYPSADTIYEQAVDNLNVPQVIGVINDLPYYDSGSSKLAMPRPTILDEGQQFHGASNTTKKGDQ